MSTGRLIILRRTPFVKAIAAALRERCGVERGDRILVAVSGGADSVALLRALHSLAGQRHWALRLAVGHVNHHLRPEADEEQRFVGELAASLDLPFHHADIDPAKSTGNLEASARRLRYHALAKLAAEANAPFVAAAHHADDQLETMLMRLIRGAGLEGLAAMAWHRPLDRDVTLVRPMLRVDHAAAVALLRDIDQGWREDASNTDLTRWRARLRADVLPVLRELRPDAAKKAAAAAGRLRRAAEIFNHQIRAAEAKHLRRTREGYAMNRDIARRLPREILIGILRRRMPGSRGTRGAAKKIERLADFIRTSRGEERRERFDAPGAAVELRITRELVQWVK